MPGGIGPLELAIVLVIVLVVFGPKRLPQLGRQLGSGMREFKDSITGKSGDDDDPDAPRLESPASGSTTTASSATAEPVREDEPVRRDA
ncbi:twin-arginine translocase TatA/TatE family subunit [Conexibacter sp. SYSU D00693]|uniref:twin-arginine translocase TatA/TatE family subunit n=1 Tax=Conexibacter sp. SYSU D00693 TaxID=2812560 RepID=UPI00196A4865|nr:twin-arginine translocase TatA/TatE family subunit [Conexibacter sp. SYSU D00693]